MSTRRARRACVCETLEPRRLLAVGLTSNTTISDTIGVAGESDGYEFTAAAGDRIILSVGEGPAAAANFEPFLALYGPGGALIDDTWDYGSAYLEVTAAAAGTYGVVVRELHNTSTGDYRLHFAKLPHAGAATDPADGDGKVLESNTTTAAAIATVGDIDVYRFTAAAGDRLIVSVGEGAAAANFEPFLALYGPTGTLIDDDWDYGSAYLEVTAATAGTYNVLVRELNNGDTGDYRLHFAKLPYAGAATDPADGEGKVLESNTTTGAAIATVGDVDLYRFTAAVGDRIILSVGEGAGATANFEPFLALYGPTGALIDDNWDYGSAYVEVTAAAAGTYGVVVRELNNTSAGDYRLHFARLPYAGPAADPADGEGKVLASNTTTAAAIGTVGDIDLYRFTAAVGDRIILSVGEGAGAAAAFEPFLALYGPNGALIDDDWNYGSAFVEVTAATAGTYNVLVRELHDSATGAYRLHFARLPHAAAGTATDPADGEGKALAPSNATTPAAIGTVGDIDLYTFTAAVGDSFILSVGDTAGNAFAPYVGVYRPDGTPLASDAGAAGAALDLLSLTQAGTYFAVVRDNANAAAAGYALQFIEVPGPQAVDPLDGDGGALASGQTLSASITIADLDAYTFQLAQGGTATVRVSELGATGFTPRVDVFGPGGARLGTNAGAASALVTVSNAAAAGTYTVVVRESGDDAVGHYALALDATPGADGRAPTVTARRFDFATDRQQLVFTLSEAMGGTLEATDLVLENLTTGATVPSEVVSGSFNVLSNQVVFRFPGYSAGILPDGDYRATLPAGFIADAAGNPLAADVTFEFFVLGGDADRSRRVDAGDYHRIDRGHSLALTGWENGDFDYSGAIDAGDYLVIDAAFLRQVAGGTSAGGPTGAGPSAPSPFAAGRPIPPAAENDAEDDADGLAARGSGVLG